MYLISALAQYKMDAFTLIFVATSKKELTSFSDKRKKNLLDAIFALYRPDSGKTEV
jgi:hypothetical protein